VVVEALCFPTARRRCCLLLVLVGLHVGKLLVWEYPGPCAHALVTSAASVAAAAEHEACSLFARDPPARLILPELETSLFIALGNKESLSHVPNVSRVVAFRWRRVAERVTSPTRSTLSRRVEIPTSYYPRGRIQLSSGMVEGESSI